jgi:hypothetical protein
LKAEGQLQFSVLNLTTFSCPTDYVKKSYRSADFWDLFILNMIGIYRPQQRAKLMNANFLDAFLSLKFNHTPS